MTTLMIMVALMMGCDNKAKDDAIEAGKIAELPKAPRIEPVTIDLQDSGKSVLDRYDFNAEKPTKVELPLDLAEISGLASTPDGRLFGHNDEEGAVQEIPYLGIGTAKKFFIGVPTIMEDLEGLAIVDDIYYLTNSSGTLFAFYENENAGISKFTEVNTWLTKEFDIEGLCHDPSTNTLLMTCKEYPGVGYELDNEKTIYSYSIDKKSVAPQPRFLIHVAELEEILKVKKFLPSSIERDPETGHFILLSGNDAAIIELTPDGRIIRAIALNPKRHPQPEGLAFGKNGELIIGDEGSGLTLYKSRVPVAMDQAVGAKAAPNIDSNRGDQTKDTNEGK